METTAAPAKKPERRRAPGGARPDAGARPEGDAPAAARGARAGVPAYLRGGPETTPDVPSPAPVPNAGDVRLRMPAPPLGLTAPERARLARVQHSAGQAATANAELPPAGAEVANARGAVAEPAAETEARAQKEAVEEVALREPPSPEIEALCARIYRVICEKRPPDEEKLVQAKPQEAADAAGAELSGSVQGETQAVQGSYDEVRQPDAGTPETTPGALDAPPATVDVPVVDAAAAAPDPVPAASVSLDADVAAAGQEMAEAGMESEAAKLVTTGPVAEARAAQGELGALAQRAPAEVLAEQQAALDAAAGDMAALQAAALARLSGARAATVAGTQGRKRGMVGTEEQMRARTAAQAQAIFAAAQAEVTAQLQGLPEAAMKKWETGKQLHATRFEQSLARVKAYIDRRHEDVLNRVADWFTGLPAWVTLEYDRAEKEFGDGICALAREISSDVNTVIAACERVVEDARAQIKALFDALPAGLRAWADEQQAAFGEQLDGLAQQARDTRENFTKDLVERAGTAVQEAREKIHGLRQEAGGLLGRIKAAVASFLEDPAKFIIEGLLSLVGIDPSAFWAVVARINALIADIARDPLGFAGNMLDGIAQGFSRFFDNFSRHMVGGFFDWLFSGLAAAGVTLPADFSLRSILGFVLDVMGIGWAKIRMLLAKHLGEKNVAAVEKAFELVGELMARGTDGIIELVKDQLDPRAVIDQIVQAGIDFLMEALVRAASVRILGLLNPVGAIVQAIEAIYRVLKWVFENAARLFSLVEAVVNGMAAVVAGNVSGMAAAVEGGLARLVGPVIDFLADYVGAGDLPQKIAETIKGFQGWIEGILDRVVAFLAAKAKSLLKSIGIGGEEAAPPPGQEGDGQIGEVVPFQGGGENHKLWVKVQGSDATLMMASTPQHVQEFLKRDEVKQAKDSKTWGKNIARALELASSANLQADRLAAAFAAQAASKTPPRAPDERKKQKQDFTSDEHELAHLLGQILDYLHGSLASRFAGDAARLHREAAKDLMPVIEGLGETPEAAGWTKFEQVLAAASAKPDTQAYRVLHEPASKQSNFGKWSHTHQQIPALNRAVEALKNASETVPDEAATEGKQAGWIAHNVTGPINHKQGDEPTVAFHALVAEVKDSAREGDARVPLEAVMKWALDKAHPDVAAELKESIKGDRLAVIRFFKELITTGKSGLVTSREHFQELWKKSSRNSGWVKDRFRDAAPGKHEWIPSDLIHKVLERAAAEYDAIGEAKAKGVRWIDLHHELRSPTTWIFFTPKVGTNGEVALHGHSGALYIAVEGGDPKPATERQNYWHDVLRDVVEAYPATGDLRGLVKELRKTVEKIVWNGKAAGVPEEHYKKPFDWVLSGGSETLVPIPESELKKPVDRVTSGGDALAGRAGITLEEVARIAGERRDEILDFFDTVAARV